MTSLVEFNAEASAGLIATLGADAHVLADLGELRTHLASHPEEHVVVLGPSVDQAAAFELAREMRLQRPTVGILLVRRRVDTALLTEALRAGVRDVVSETDLAGLANAVDRASDLSRALRDGALPLGAPREPAFRARVVTVFSAKGGCGKTTMSTNMAAHISAGGQRRVALLDLDLAFGDVAIAMQLYPTHTLADAVRLEETLDVTALRTLMTTHTSGVQTLVAPLDPTKAESIPASLVARVIDLLASEFDYLIIDCPPVLDDRVLTALDASDVVALLATLDVPAIKNLKLTLDTLNLLAFPADRLRVVINRSDSKVGLEIGDVEKTLGLPISARIPSSVDVPISTNRGAILALEKPEHPVSKAFAAFTDGAVLGQVDLTGAGDSTTPVSGRRTSGSRWRKS